MKEEIYRYILGKGQGTPHEISRNFPIGMTMIHRHLKKLLSENKIAKVGKSPKVFYIPNKVEGVDEILDINLDDKYKQEIENNFSYIRPNGVELLGIDAFSVWCSERKLNVNKMAEQYCKTRKEYIGLANKNFTMSNGFEVVKEV